MFCNLALRYVDQYAGVPSPCCFVVAAVNAVVSRATPWCLNCKNLSFLVRQLVIDRDSYSCANLRSCSIDLCRAPIDDKNDDVFFDLGVPPEKQIIIPSQYS